MLKSKLLSALAALAFIGAISSAHASVVVDQSQLNYDIGIPFVFSANDPDYPIGQSFTAGMSGLFSGINLVSNSPITGTGNSVTLNVFSGNGVNGTLLGSITEGVSNTTISSFGIVGADGISLNVSSLGINLVAGNQYTFDITNVAGTSNLATNGIIGDENNPYAGGQIYTGPGYGSPAGWDLMFQTTVATVPEPTSLLLMLAGLGMLTFVARRKKQG